MQLNENERREAVTLLGGAGNMSHDFWRDLFDRGFDITPFRRVIKGRILGPA